VNEGTTTAGEERERERGVGSSINVDGSSVGREREGGVEIQGISSNVNGGGEGGRAGEAERAPEDGTGGEGAKTGT
jgi:hypothetical protein